MKFSEVDHFRNSTYVAQIWRTQTKVYHIKSQLFLVFTAKSKKLQDLVTICWVVRSFLQLPPLPVNHFVDTSLMWHWWKWGKSLNGMLWGFTCLILNCVLHWKIDFFRVGLFIKVQEPTLLGISMFSAPSNFETHHSHTLVFGSDINCWFHPFLSEVVLVLLMLNQYLTN